MSDYFFQSLNNLRSLKAGILNAIKNENPYHNQRYKENSDISFSRLFATVFKNIARYNSTAKEWFVYNGIVWKIDNGAMQVERLAKYFAEAFLIYSAKIDNGSYRMKIAKLGERNRRKTIIQDARDFNYIRTEDFDKDSDLFNCQNCVLKLSTLEQLQHEPKYLLSKVSNVFFDKSAKSDFFLSFLNEVLENKSEVIDYLQKILGYALTGENLLEECYILYGATTRNGKGTLTSTLKYLFGDYGMNIEPETLAQKDKNSRNASGDIARLNGCRFLNMSEPPKRMIFDEALLKKLLGRDPITARNLYEKEFEFIPIFKLFINTNYLPIVKDDTLFSSERVWVIPFERKFKEEEQDKTLKNKLQTKENISGLFNWLLIGLKKFNEQGFSIVPPKAIKEATAEYRKNSDKIANFVEECFIKAKEPDSSYSTRGQEAYKVYTIWCKENGYLAEGKKNFFEELRKKKLLANSGFVNGHTERNVIKGYEINKEYREIK